MYLPSTMTMVVVKISVVGVPVFISVNPMTVFDLSEGVDLALVIGTIGVQYVGYGTGFTSWGLGVDLEGCCWAEYPRWQLTAAQARTQRVDFATTMIVTSCIGYVRILSRSFSLCGMPRGHARMACASYYYYHLISLALRN